VWMLTLAIDQLEVELKWLEKLADKAAQRAPAQHPQLVRH
jgi:hypothetical protein